MKKLGKRKMVKVFKQYFPEEYNSNVADYAVLPDWERLSCHGCKVAHEVFCGVESFIWTTLDGKSFSMPVLQFDNLFV